MGNLLLCRPFDVHNMTSEALWENDGLLFGDCVLQSPAHFIGQVQDPGGLVRSEILAVVVVVVNGQGERLTGFVCPLDPAMKIPAVLVRRQVANSVAKARQQALSGGDIQRQVPVVKDDEIGGVDGPWDVSASQLSVVGPGRALNYRFHRRYHKIPSKISRRSEV